MKSKLGRYQLPRYVEGRGRDTQRQRNPLIVRVVYLLLIWGVRADAGVHDPAAVQILSQSFDGPGCVDPAVGVEDSVGDFPAAVAVDGIAKVLLCPE